MSAYAAREEPARLVELFNRTVEPVVGRCYLGTHLCFGNYKARAVAKRTYAPMFPAFLDLVAHELHFELASRELSEIELLETVAERHDVGAGVIDVKSYYVETPEDVEERIRACLVSFRPRSSASAPTAASRRQPGGRLRPSSRAWSRALAAPCASPSSLAKFWWP